MMVLSVATFTFPTRLYTFGAPYPLKITQRKKEVVAMVVFGGPNSTPPRFVYSQLVTLQPVGILFLVMFVLNGVVN